MPTKKEKCQNPSEFFRGCEYQNPKKNEIQIN